VGTTAAYGLSAIATFLPGAFEASGLDPRQSLYYETSTAIIALVLAGRFLEARARAHTGDAIRALVALGATSARVRRPGGIEEDAHGARAPIQRLVDDIAAVFVPIVFVIASLALLAWFVLGPEPKLSHALSAFIAVLIIACPCALGLATPTAIMVGTGRGAAR